MIRKLKLTGDPYTIGQQHGQQVFDLRADIQAAIDHRLKSLNIHASDTLDAHTHEQTLLNTWEAAIPELLVMLRGICDALALDWQAYFRYTIASYLTDQARAPLAGDQGCSTWAAGDPLTRNGETLLVKNRDYWLDHEKLQCLAYTRPDKGHPYLNLTSAGSPGVFSSGMNIAGLAVADTHVVSLDIGPGLPRYFLMMYILENFDNVPSALDYLKSVRFMGNGTLILQDMQGQAAVVECGYNGHSQARSQDGYVISTNHYLTQHLDDRWLPRNRREHLVGNSEARFDIIRQALTGSKGQVDLAWAQGLMRLHTDPLSSLCRHTDLEPQRVTISSAIYMPREKTLYLANGRPCREEYYPYSFVD